MERGGRGQGGVWVIGVARAFIQPDSLTHCGRWTRLTAGPAPFRPTPPPLPPPLHPTSPTPSLATHSNPLQVMAAFGVLRDSPPSHPITIHIARLRASHVPRGPPLTESGYVAGRERGVVTWNGREYSGASCEEFVSDGWEAGAWVVGSPHTRPTATDLWPGPGTGFERSPLQL